jgi:hypothetical protein
MGLCGLTGVRDEFRLAAIVQKLEAVHRRHGVSGRASNSALGSTTRNPIRSPAPLIAPISPSNGIDPEQTMSRE